MPARGTAAAIDQVSFRVQLACSEVMLSKIEKAGLGDVFTRLDLKVGVRGGALW